MYLAKKFAYNKKGTPNAFMLSVAYKIWRHLNHC